MVVILDKYLYTINNKYCIMSWFDELKDPDSNFVFNIIILSVLGLVGLLIIIYVFINLKDGDKIYQIIANLLSVLIGLIGGRTLGSKNKDKKGESKNGNN